MILEKEKGMVAVSPEQFKWFVKVAKARAIEASNGIAYYSSDGELIAMELGNQKYVRR